MFLEFHLIPTDRFDSCTADSDGYVTFDTLNLIRCLPQQHRNVSDIDKFSLAKLIISAYQLYRSVS